VYPCRCHPMRGPAASPLLLMPGALWQRRGTNFNLDPKACSLSIPFYNLSPKIIKKVKVKKRRDGSHHKAKKKEKQQQQLHQQQQQPQQQLQQQPFKIKSDPIIEEMVEAAAAVLNAHHNKTHSAPSDSHTSAYEGNSTTPFHASNNFIRWSITKRIRVFLTASR